MKDYLKEGDKYVQIMRLLAPGRPVSSIRLARVLLSYNQRIQLLRRLLAPIGYAIPCTQPKTNHYVYTLVKEGKKNK